MFATEGRTTGKPRVGYVLKMYPRFSETFILNEILAHEAAGLDVHIYSLKLPIDGHFHEALARVKAPVTYIGQDGLRAVNFWQDVSKAAKQCPGIWDAMPATAGIDAHEVHAAALLATRVKACGITHLHAHFATSAATVAMLGAAMSGVTYSFTAHAKDIYIDSVDHDHMRRLLQGAARVITVSDYNAAHFVRQYGHDADKVTRIYNGLPMASLEYQSPVTRQRRILGVGRLVEKKGFDDLVAACGILRARGVEFACDIIGDGSLAPVLGQQIAELGLHNHVHLLGPKPQGEVMSHIRRAAVLAAPCIVGQDGNRDGLPTVLLEAMALGTPCISTDVTGITEAVEHERTGLIVPQRDPQVLADAIEQLLDSPSLRCDLAKAARQRVEECFDIDVNTKHLRTIFADSCSRQPSGNNVNSHYLADGTPLTRDASEVTA